MLTALAAVSALHWLAQPGIGQEIAADLAYAVPDVIPGELTDSGAPERQRGAALFAVVRNPLPDSVRIEHLSLDGTPVEQLRRERVVSWWRVRPNPIPPRGAAEITLRLQRVTTPQVTLAAHPQAPLNPVRILVPTTAPELRIVTCAFSQDMRTVYIIAQTRATYSGEGEPVRSIARVCVDVVDVTAACRRPGVFRGLAPVAIPLSAPFVRGARHFIRIEDSKGRACASFVRASSSVFEIGTFGNFHIEDFAAAGFNAYQSFRGLSKEQVDAAHALGLRITAPYFQPRRAYFYDDLDLTPVRDALQPVKGHPGLLAYYLEDEPDVFDWQYCGSFKHWFEVTLKEPVNVARVGVHELKTYAEEMTLAYAVGDQWREAGRRSSEELAGCPAAKSGRRVEFVLEHVTAQRLRVLIPRASHMPGIRELDIFDRSGANVSRQGSARASSRFLAFYGKTGDEADKAIDGDLETYWRASHSVPAWVGATGQEMARRAEFYETTDPAVPTMCLVNNTYTPGNWFTYAQVADIFDTDPYAFPAPGRKADYYSVYRKSLIACRASAPNPCFITLWMGWGGEHCRCLTEQEERIMAWYALGAGARGINYYIHSSSYGDNAVMTGPWAFPKGPERDRALQQAQVLWQGIGRLNRQLKQVGDWLAAGYPVGAVADVPAGLWAKAVLCAPEALVLVVVNQAHDASGEEFTVTPVSDASVTVDVPPWLPCRDVAEITPEGLSPLTFRHSDGRLTVAFPRIDDGKLVLIR